MRLLLNHAIIASTFLAQLLIVSTPTLAENWPGWRGPRGDGTSLETGIPTQWDADGKNIAWKTPIPGVGHASPIVWGDRVFVVSAEENADGHGAKRLLLCIDRRSGKILWRRCVLEAPLEKKHRLNSYASSTPVTDGRLVYTVFLDTAKIGRLEVVKKRPHVRGRL